MAAQVSIPAFEITKSSYGCPGIPIAGTFAYDAQVSIPALKVTKYSYGCPCIPISGQVFLWLPRWACPGSKLPGIPIACLQLLFGVDAGIRRRLVGHQAVERSFAVDSSSQFCSLHVAVSSLESCSLHL